MNRPFNIGVMARNGHRWRIRLAPLMLSLMLGATLSPLAISFHASATSCLMACCRGQGQAICSCTDQSLHSHAAEVSWEARGSHCQGHCLNQRGGLTLSQPLPGQSKLRMPIIGSGPRLIGHTGEPCAVYIGACFARRAPPTLF